MQTMPKNISTPTHGTTRVQSLYPSWQYHSHLYSFIIIMLHDQSLEKHILCKIGWDSNTFQLIAWDAHEWAFCHLPRFSFNTHLNCYMDWWTLINKITYIMVNPHYAPFAKNARNHYPTFSLANMERQLPVGVKTWPGWLKHCLRFEPPSLSLMPYSWNTTRSGHLQPACYAAQMQCWQLHSMNNTTPLDGSTSVSAG